MTIPQLFIATEPTRPAEPPTREAASERPAATRTCPECQMTYPPHYFDGEICFDCAPARGNWGRRAER
jgi:hypothetical protein